MLAEIAAAHGVTVDAVAARAAVLADWEAGKARGRAGLARVLRRRSGAGSAPCSTSRGSTVELQVRVDETAMPTFLAACFAD